MDLGLWLLTIWLVLFVLEKLLEWLLEEKSFIVHQCELVVYVVLG